MNRHDLIILASTATGLTIADVNNILQATILAVTSVYSLIRIIIEVKKHNNQK